MAFADLGMMGTAGTTTANQNSLVCTATTAGAAVGDLVVVAVAVDNRVTGGGDDLSVSGVTDSVGNTYVKARQEATNLAAQTGSSVSIWWSRIKTAIPVTTGTITAAFTTNTTSDAQCMAVRKFSVSADKFIEVHGTNATTSTTTNPGSLNVTTDNAEHLRIRAIGCEYDVTQALTVTAGGWAAWTEIASAATGTTSEQVLEVEWIINTGTGTASAPTLGSACDNSSVYVAFQEVTPVPEIIDPPTKTVRTTSKTVAIIAALSAVAESVFVPPSVAAPSAAATSETVVVTSRRVYDQTSAPVFVPPSSVPSVFDGTAAPAVGANVFRLERVVYDQTSAPVFKPAAVAVATSTSAAATSGTVVVTSRRVYDQTSTPVFVPAPVVATPVGFQTIDAVWLRQRKILPDGYTVLVTVPTVATATPSAFGYQTVDATWRRQRKALPDGSVAPVFVPTVAVDIGRFVPDAPQSGFARPRIKPVPLSSYVLAYPAPPALTPTAFGYQTVDAVWRKQNKVLPDGFASKPVYPPAASPTISTAIAGAYSTATVGKSRVVYDQTSTPVFVVAAGAGVELKFVPDGVRAYSPRLRVKPVQLSAFVLEVDDFESVPSPASGSHSTATVITRRVVYDPITGPVAPTIITPPIDTALASVHSSATVITRRVVYDQIAARPAFPPVFVGVPGRFVPDAPQSFIKSRIKAVPLSAFVFAYPIDDLAQDSSEQFIRRKRKVLPDGIAQPPFRPIVPTQTPSAFGYQTVDAVWRKLKKRLPEGYDRPLFRPVITTPSAFGYQTVDAVWRKQKKVLPEGYDKPIFRPLTATPSAFGYQTVDAVWRKQKRVLPEGYDKPAFRPLTATPVAFGYQTVDAVWRKQKKVLPDGYAKPLLPPVFVPPVVPPTVGGGGPGFSYQRYERLLEELYKKKKKAPPKAKKALAKAIAVVKQVDTRAEDLARLLQALEAAAATSTQNALATINAANAAAEQARLVLEQQRLRQLREEDDLILLMLDEDD